MLFCAKNYFTICDGLSKLFSTNIEDVFLHLSNINHEKRDDYIAKFIKGNLKNHITDIDFYHLSRSISPHKVLYPLDRLLLTENELSLFFREYGIEFSKSDGIGISMSVNGSRVSNDIIDDHFILGKRFTSDMCICGFQILENIDHFRPGYLHNILKKSPEIIQSIDENLKLNGALIQDYNKRSEYYCYIGTVEFSEVGFSKGMQCEIFPSTDFEVKEQKYVSNLFAYAMEKYLYPNTRPITNAMIYCEKPIRIIDRVQPKDIWQEEI